MMVGDDDEEYAFVCLCVTNNDLFLTWPHVRHEK